MNKKQYLDALEKELRQYQVADVEDVLADFEAHFTRKALDGYTEEEISRKLGTPQDIARDFTPGDGKPDRANTPKGSVLMRIGLFAGDFAALPVLFVLFLWAAAMLVVSLGMFALGVYLCLGLDLLAFIPVLTVAGGILFGSASIAASVLMCMGSIWFWMLASQMTLAYMHWHGNRWSGRRGLSLPVMPQLTGKKRRVFRTVVLVALVGFILLFIAGFIVLSIQAGTFGFWHHWHWFEPVKEIVQGV